MLHTGTAVYIRTLNIDRDGEKYGTFYPLRTDANLRRTAERSGKRMLMTLVVGSVFPHSQLDFERVGIPDTKRGYESAIGPSNDQQVWVAFDVVAERQSQTFNLPTYLRRCQLLGA